MLWNGSHLGSLPSPRSVTTIDGRNIASFVREGESWCCIVRRCDNPKALCLLDECKPLFGALSIGTHSAKIGNSNYLLTRMPKDGDEYILDPCLDAYPYKLPSTFSAEIRNILLFRNIFGVLRAGERTIVVREDGGDVFPVAWYETMPKPVNNSSPSSAAFSRWMNEPPNLALCRMFHIERVEEISPFIDYVRQKIREKDAGENAWIGEEAIARLIARLHEGCSYH